MTPHGISKPFAAPAKPFAIGLAPLAGENFLLFDEQLARYTAEKRALYQQQFEDVCMAEYGTEEAQAEAADLILAHLREHHPTRYDLDEKQIVASDGKVVDLSSPTHLPLAPVALLVQDDLVLMRRNESGWRLVAVSLCFPSSWNLNEKFGKPLEAVHSPVPMPSNMGLRINRIFDNLQPDVPVWRENWSLDGDGELRHDQGERNLTNRNRDLDGEVFLRQEYQTLHKLPLSGDILFSILIKTRPICTFANTDNGRLQLEGLYEQYLNMSRSERLYKGIQEAVGFLAWLDKEGIKA